MLAAPPEFLSRLLRSVVVDGIASIDVILKPLSCFLGGDESDERLECTLDRHDVNFSRSAAETPRDRELARRTADSVAWITSTGVRLDELRRLGCRCGTGAKRVCGTL